MHALRIVRPRAAFAVSSSQLKDFDRCERAWYLASVARAPDDAEAGGQYLLQGDLYDEACQRHQARLDVDVETLVGAVRAKPGLRGAALTTPDAKWAELAERAQRMLRATERFLPPPKTAQIQHGYRVDVAGYEDRGGLVITGKSDFRDPRGGVVWDTKTTADRGEGRGRDATTPPRALDAAGLAGDTQAKLYAWCEFQMDPNRATVRCVWIYASKASPMAPSGWRVEHTFTRFDVLAWFATYVRPRLDRMVELHLASEIELVPHEARANHDGCARCFRRAACDPFTGRQAHVRGEEAMVDLAKLRSKQGTPAVAFMAQSFHAPEPTPPRETVMASLVAEAAAVAGGTQDDRRADVGLVAINRPDAPPNPHAAVAADFPGQAIIETSGHEVTEDAAPLPPPAEAPAAFPSVPKRGRGRPRRHPQQHEADGSIAVYDTAEASTAALAVVLAPSGGASGPAALDVESLERLATAWQRVADAADAAVAVANAELRARGVKL